MLFVLVAVAILLVLAVVVAASRGSAVVTVNDQIELSLPRDRVEQYAFGPLGSIPGATVT